MQTTTSIKNLLKVCLEALLWLIISPLDLVFSILVTLKNTLYDRGYLPQNRLSRPVISIGNLSMGGTGKSPMISEFAAQLTSLGKKVVVLSRGYGRVNSDLSLEVMPETPWKKAGDEPLMLARRHLDVKVLVGPSRYEAAKATSFIPDVYLVDDGFQHRQLHRDWDIVLIDVTQPPPPRFLFLPFREGISSLKRASLIIITRCPNPEAATPLINRIRKKNPNVPILTSYFETGALQPLKPASNFKTKTVLAYSGIERPEKFFTMLKRLGFHVPFTMKLKDHQEMKPFHWERLLKEARQRNVFSVVTTEKDAVKVENTFNSDIMLSFLPIVTRWHKPTYFEELIKEFMNRKHHEKIA